MFRPAARSVLRRNPVSAPLRTTYRQSRSFTFGAAEKKSSFKSTFLRWAAVGGIVYYYSTSSVFADEPKFIEERPPLSTIDDERPPSLIDEVLQASRKNSTEHNDPKKHGESPEKSSEDDSSAAGHSLEAEGGPEGLAEEAGQEGAFNPETGEINWDCPCLGGMAHGPCGEQFKTAFSCFVYSTADPKGVDCIDKFKDMQTCFQAHPEIYGAELDDEEAQQSETLKPLDLDNVEETRSPATSSNVPTETVVDPGVAKPDTKPVDADKPEDKVAETSEGVDTEQTKS